MAKRNQDTDGYSSRGKPTKKATTKLRFEDYEFIRIELSAEEKEDFALSDSARLSPYEALADLSTVGYKFSTSWSTDGKTCTASLTCTDTADPNAGGIISGKGAVLAQAILRLHYKVTEIVGDRTWREAENDRGGSYVEPF